MTTSSGITRSKVCRECGVDKLIDAYGRDKRTPDGYGCTCVDCRGNGKGNGKAKRVEPAPEPITTLTSALEVLPGFGFRASIEDGLLSIEQDRDDGNTDSITLSRTEAKVLFAQFSEWAT